MENLSFDTLKVQLMRAAAGETWFKQEVGSETSVHTIFS